MTFSFICI